MPPNELSKLTGEWCHISAQRPRTRRVPGSWSPPAGSLRIKKARKILEVRDQRGAGSASGHVPSLWSVSHVAPAEWIFAAVLAVQRTFSGRVSMPSPAVSTVCVGASRSLSMLPLSRASLQCIQNDSPRKQTCNRQLAHHSSCPGNSSGRSLQCTDNGSLPLHSAISSHEACPLIKPLVASRDCAKRTKIQLVSHMENYVC